MPPHHEPRRLPAGRAVRPREAQNQNKRVIPAVVLSDGYSPLWHLAVATGLRRSELIGLRWQDVGEKRGTIAVVQNVVAYKGAALIEEPKTPAARRTVTLDPMCLALLRAHRKRQAERELQSAAWRGLDLIFTTPDGGPLNPNNVSRNFALLLTKAVKQRKADHPALPPFPRIRFHDMRHTHATLLLQKGEAVHTVSARLGHANPAITLGIYAHVTPKMQESAAATIGRLLTEAS
jgi:integrase